MLSVLCLLMLGWFGDTSVPPTALGPASFSVTDYGASLDPRVDSTAGFEGAITAAQASMVGRLSGGTPAALVRVPAHAEGYKLTRPLFLPPGVDLVGDGWSTQVAMDINHYPVVVAGVDDPGTVPADRPSLTGILDNTVGQRWGWSTAGGRFIQVQHGPTWGPYDPTHDAYTYWSGLSTLTLDLCLSLPAPVPAGAPICGQGDTQEAMARPWLLASNGENAAEWVLREASCNTGELDRCDRSIFFPAPPAGIARLTIQDNLATREVTVWVNGVQVAARTDGNPGKSFMICNDWPLVFGVGQLAPGASTQLPTPMVVAGWHLASAPRYVVKTVGSAQARLDGQPITDLWQFFEPGMAWLPCDDAPAPGRRWVDVCSTTARWRSAGLIMRTRLLGGSPSRIEGLDLRSGGPCVLLGTVLNCRINNCRLLGSHGPAIGSVPIQPSYQVSLRDVELGGAYGVQLWHTWLTTSGVVNVRAYSLAAVQSRGGMLDLRGLHVGDNSAGVSAIRILPGQWGGTYRLTDLVVDNESGPFSSALIDVWPEATSDPVHLIVDTPYVASPGKQPVVRLNAKPGAVTATARLLGFSPAATQVSSCAAWTATMDGVPITGGRGR